MQNQKTYVQNYFARDRLPIKILEFKKKIKLKEQLCFDCQHHLHVYITTLKFQVYFGCFLYFVTVPSASAKSSE